MAVKALDKPGLFITLEGGEGAGKTTLALNLARFFQNLGREVVLTREPGGTPNAEALRSLLVEGEVERWSALSETLLLYAARVDHIDRLIQPALDRGAIVLCDRFTDSTKAYQGGAGGLDEDRINAIHDAALGTFQPDLTLLIDLDPEIGLRRTASRGETVTRFEKQLISYHNNLKQTFLNIAQNDPERCIIIDGNQPSDAVARSAEDYIKSRLGDQL